MAEAQPEGLCRHPWLGLAFGLSACVLSRRGVHGARSTWPARCSRIARGCGEIDDELIEGWVVKYRSSDRERLGLAVVEATKAQKMLQPLCTWEDGERTFVVDEEAEPFPLDDRVVYILDDVCISHRQLPRPENPHGEETEDTYLVGELEDLEDVEIVIRPEREPPSM